jgi:hypothetical protein
MAGMKWIYFFEGLICLLADHQLRRTFYATTSFLPEVITVAYLLLIHQDATDFLLTTLTTRFDGGS